MEKTPRYQLSQWEKTDRILMEDFNADNANLEAALTSLAADTARLSSAKADLTALNSAKSALQTEDARLNSVKLEMVTILDKTYSVSNASTLSIPVGSLGGYAVVAVDLALPNATTTIKGGGSSESAISLSGDAPLSGALAEASGKSRILMFPMKYTSAHIRTTTYGENHSIYLGKSSSTFGTQISLLLTFRTALTYNVKVKITGIK